MTGISTKQAGAPRWSALQRWTLGVTSIAAFMAGMDALVVTTALPTIHSDLRAATSALSWTVAAYTLGFAAVVLAGVALGDRYGRRQVFLTGLTLFTLGSAGCALSPNVSLLFSSAGGYASAATFVDGLRPALVAVGVVTAIGVAAVNRFRGTVANGGQTADTTVRMPNQVPELEPAGRG